MNRFDVSVIVPVYNAEKFLAIAVESCIKLPQVREIILVEDGSTDNSLSVCKELQSKFDKVKLFQHPDKQNRGAGATRNLGLRNVTSPFVAFLDADDVFLPSRFDATEKIFSMDMDAYGVYEAIGVKFFDDEGKRMFSALRNLSWDEADKHVTRLKVSSSRDVYKYLITGRKGFFSTLGVTIRTAVLKKGFVFNESLRLHQDTELWIRLAYNFKFVEGSREPVALRGVHADNRISRQNLQSKYKYYSALYDYFRHKKIPFSLKMFLFRALVRNNPRRKYLASPNRVLKIAELIFIGMKEITKLPVWP